MDKPTAKANSNTNSNPGLNPGADAALHKGIDKVAEPVKSTVDRLSTAAHETVDKIAATANDAAERFSDKTKFVSEAPNRAMDYSRSWVQDKPLEAIGAALAIGFLLGRLTGR